MAIGQVTVPHINGYDFGVGADLATGSPMGKVVVGPPTPVERAAGAAVNFQVHRIQSTEDLERALGIDAEASYGSGSFGANMSARFSYAKKNKIQSSSLFMLVTAHVELEFLSIDDPVLSEDAQALVSSSGAFKERYGNMFVRGISRGGLFIGTIRIETRSSDESKKIAAELQGSYGLFEASAKTSFSDVQTKYGASTFIDMYHEGGPTDLHITNFTDPQQLLDNANRFIDEFKNNPDTVARPFSVILAPTTIAKGPVHPDAASVEHAQDVLVACSKARSRLLDKINLLEYILDNTSRFAFTDGADQAAVQKALEDFQADLELVAECASTAIRSPAEAAFPAIYAKNNGSDYPKAVLPDPMPKPKGAKMVAVPDFGGCKNWIECNEAATRVGLVPEQVHATIEPGDVFKVLDVSPPAGTSVPEGSVVRIVTQPAKVVVNPPDKRAILRGNLAGVLVRGG
jgi:hypothetical protein